MAKKREKTGKEWARYGLKRVNKEGREGSPCPPERSAPSPAAPRQRPPARRCRAAGPGSHARASPATTSGRAHPASTTRPFRRPERRERPASCSSQARRLETLRRRRATGSSRRRRCVCSRSRRRARRARRGRTSCRLPQPLLSDCRAYSRETNAAREGKDARGTCQQHGVSEAVCSAPGGGHAPHTLASLRHDAVEPPAICTTTL